MADKLVSIGFYGRLAEVIGRERQVPLPAGGCTLGEIKGAIARLDSAAGEAILARGTRGAIDDRFAGDDALAAPGQRIEFMSPLSGG